MSQKATAARTAPLPETCDVKVKLLSEYLIAAEAHLDSLTVLSARIHAVDKAEYVRLEGLTEKCQTESERARMALTRHTVSHDC